MIPDLGEGAFWRPRYGLPRDQPNPKLDPDGYVRWLTDNADPGSLQPLAFPMVEDVYTVGPGSAPAEKTWFVVVTEPRCESGVAREIEHVDDGSPREGFEALNIQLKTIEVRRGRKVEACRPLFPRYVFAGLARPQKDLTVVRGADGAREVLGRCGAPLAVPVEIIADLRKRELAGEFDETGPPKWIVEGADLRVIEGPFASFPGVVEKINRRRRFIKAGISIFGRITRIELGFGQFEAAHLNSPVCPCR